MLKIPFKVFPKKSLGVDIGTSAIRVVELSEWKGNVRLENYGEIQTLIFHEKPFRIFERRALLLASQQIGDLLTQLLKEANIKSQEASFSIPDFSTFFTAIEFPPMEEKELEDAVRYEARRHVPLPLSEVALDWKLIDQVGKKDSQEKRAGAKVLLVAVPKEVIGQYKDAAQIAQLNLVALEAEVFSLIRAVKQELEEASAIIEIGAQSTTVSIVEAEELKATHSFDVSGNELSQILSRSLEIDYEEAEILKKTEGIKSEGAVREALLPLIDLVLAEVKRVSENFARREGGEVKKFILAGGTALLPGLKDYFSQQLKKEVVIADPFQELLYPDILKETLKDMGPSFAIACGMAKRGLE